MANTLRIKRNTTNAGDPTISQLKGGELAYNDLTDKLFIGKGESGGHASSVELIGGKGAFVTLATAQTISGAKSFVNNAVNFCYGINIRDLGDTSTLGTISGNSTQVRLESKVEDLRLVNNNGASRLVISDVRSPSTGSLLLGADGCANLQVQSSSPGLVVTQLGSGLALQINDSSNDTTPFVITGGGYVGFGTDTPEKQIDVRNGNMQIKYDTANALGALIQLKKGRGSATAPAIVLAGDTLGTLYFSAYGESAGYAGGATVEAKMASGQTVSPTSLPTNLVFSTTPNGSVAPVAAMTIGHDKVITVAGRITGLSTPTQDTDAATKAYVDAARSGLDVKASCRVASTGNIDLSTSLTSLTVDTISLRVGDRVLVKDQTSAVQNGIYVIGNLSGSGPNWVRASDFNEDAEVTPGAFTFIEEGSTHADSGWVLVTDAPTSPVPVPIVVGSSSLAFAQFSGAGQIIAGAGLSKNGNTLSLATTGTAGTYRSVTTDAYGRVTSGSNPTTLSGYGITDAQPLDSDLTAVAALSSTGFAVRTGANTWALRSFSALNGIGMGGSAVGLTINNGAGVGGSVEFTLDKTLESLAYNLGQAIALVEGDSGTYSKSWFPLYSASTQISSSNHCTAYEVGTTGLTVLASTTQAAARSAIGCSSMSTQSSADVNITGGSITNLAVFDDVVIDGGTYVAA